jgi:ketosteroid isomerase-like protein
MSPVTGVGLMFMSDEETEIRTLIERWAVAVHEGDIEAVLADHAEDIVMFDVPPPADGVRGIDAYRAVWPDFFTWQRTARFEIVSLEVAAGVDVAYAHALLRCGTDEELERDPDNRLRLTLGLRRARDRESGRSGGRWLIAHEHHSFPDR